MKRLITAVALVVMFLSVSFAATKDVDKKSPAPVPEVIKCEGSGSCEMTEIEKLPKPKEKKNADKQ